MSAESRLDLIAAELADLELVEWPLSPEQVVSGSPGAEGAITWRSADRTAAAGFWRCRAGAFQRTYPWTEVATVLAGAATVTAAGAERRLVPGTLLVLPVGITATWSIEDSVEKAFHLSAADPLPV